MLQGNSASSEVGKFIFWSDTGRFLLYNTLSGINDIVYEPIEVN